MEYNIYDLMEGFADDTIALSQSGAADLRRIEELTMNKIKEQTPPRRAKKPARRITRMVLVAAIVAALCAVTVVAVSGNAAGKVTPADTARAGEMDDKTTAAFSDGISTQQADIRDANGNTIQLAKMERVPTDPETAQRLVGGYLMALDNAAMTVKDDYYGTYTITLETMLIDEKGKGMITYSVENPKGIYSSTEGFSYGEGVHTCMPSVEVHEPSEEAALRSEEARKAVSTKIYLDTENTTDTHVQAIMYFAICGGYQKGDPIYVTLGSVYSGQMQAICITPTSYVPAKTFTEKGGTHVSVSSLGIQVDTGDLSGDETRNITIRYKDASEFVVWSGGINNCTVAFGGYGYEGTDGGNYRDASYYNFNRLVDVDQIASVEVVHHYYEAVGQGAEKNITRVYEP